MRNIFGDQGSMERNFWEYLNLFLGNKGTTVNFRREQGNIHSPPPLGGPQSYNSNFIRSEIKLIWTKTPLTKCNRKVELEICTLSVPFGVQGFGKLYIEGLFAQEYTYTREKCNI